ncbi:DUF427-domain-containing protein [Russula earlei]|uniref:DUF427-domain-containing protein n=1 Tax=Russula earlei TaxID=71964 RepID=A0ACC0UJL0_9AGAM|nr:DUF427-domain-containing protein [Russula earlei]
MSYEGFHPFRSPVPFPHPGYIEDAQRRVRVLFGGQYIVDTQQAMLGWEQPYYPSYFFHSSDLPERFLSNPKQIEKSTTYDLVVGDRTARAAVTVRHEGDFKDLVKIAFDKVDAWLEEDEEISFHPKDPYKRIDVRQSSRHVRIEIDGVELANTNKPRLLFETGLPVRTYIPKGDVRLEHLSHSTLTTGCPYKGVANYYDVNFPSGKKEGLAWWYRTAFLESAGINGYIAFLDEKVDVFVNGQLAERPKPLFS